MTITEATIESLRTAAMAGDADAARELGRLLSMLRVDTTEPTDDPDVAQSWPEERWLRRALRARPDDVLTATLLAGRLVQQIAFRVLEDEGRPDAGRSAEAAAIRVEAEHLYRQVLRADPDNPAAITGTATLAAWQADSTKDGLERYDRFSYYEVCASMGSGSFQTDETVVTTDVEELRWATEWLVSPIVGLGEDSLGMDLHVFIHSDAERTDVVDLGAHFDGALRWDRLTIPALTGTYLPPGHSVQGGNAHYGYSMEWG